MKLMKWMLLIVLLCGGCASSSTIYVHYPTTCREWAYNHGYELLRDRSKKCRMISPNSPDEFDVVLP